MRKYFLLLLILGTLIGGASAKVSYKVQVNESSIYMNTSIELNCDQNCPVNQWNLRWTKPKNSEILWIKDSKGKITDYTVNGRTINLNTNQGAASYNETVKIGFKINKDSQKIKDNLNKLELSLPSFKDEKTVGIVKVDDLISGWTSYGFKTSYSEDKLVFKGEGPLNIRANYGKGFQTNHFVFFGDKRNETEISYRVTAGTLGFLPDFDRFPVVVLTDKKYNETVNQWSAGEYIAGSIRIRKSLGKDFKPVLAHEVVHGFNDRVLKWDQTSSSYFDEGTAEYVEFLMKKKLALRHPELFGDTKSYTKEKNGFIYTYRIPPFGDKEALWNYYQKDKEFMKKWSPGNSDPEIREFGYAYSALIIRNYVSRMNGSLKELYKTIELNRTIKDPEKKWSFYNQRMDMTPCKFESREKFRNCLEKVRNYDYPVYTIIPNKSKKELDIKQVELKKRKTNQTVPKKFIKEKTRSASRKLVRSIEEFVSKLVKNFSTSIKNLLD